MIKTYSFNYRDVRNLPGNDDILSLVYDVNPNGCTAWQDVKETKIYVKCENKPKDSDFYGIHWEEEDDLS